MEAEAEGEAVKTKEANIAAAVVCLGGFWYFASQVDPQPKWLRWATWW